MTKEESLQSQKTLRTINEYLMDMYRKGKLKRREEVELPKKYESPDFIWKKDKEE